MSTSTQPSGPSVVSSTRCRELLGTGQIGRVGYIRAHRPRILPVNYAWHGGLIVFRTSSHGELSELAHRTPVAFEVDHLDEAARSGWSVVVNGFSQGITTPTDVSILWKTDAVQPWAPGSRTLFIGIAVEEITGRMFGPDTSA